MFVIAYHNQVVFHRVELKRKHERRAECGHATLAGATTPGLETLALLFQSRSGFTYVTAVIVLNM